MISWALGGIWSKFVALIIGAIGLVVGLYGLRYRIRAGARADLEAEMRARTLERLQHARDIEDVGAGMSDGDVFDRLRDKGLIRD